MLPFALKRVLSETLRRKKECEQRLQNYQNRSNVEAESKALLEAQLREAEKAGASQEQIAALRQLAQTKGLGAALSGAMDTLRAAQSAAHARGQWIEQQEAAGAAFVQQMQAAAVPQPAQSAADLQAGLQALYEGRKAGEAEAVQKPATSTPSATATREPTSTLAHTPSPTGTPTLFFRTPTNTSPPTETPTPSITPTHSATPTSSATQTASVTPTASKTPILWMSTPTNMPAANHPSPPPTLYPTPAGMPPSSPPSWKPRGYPDPNLISQIPLALSRGGSIDIPHATSLIGLNLVQWGSSFSASTSVPARSLTELHEEMSGAPSSVERSVKIGPLSLSGHRNVYGMVDYEIGLTFGTKQVTAPNGVTVEFSRSYALRGESLGSGLLNRVMTFEANYLDYTARSEVPELPANSAQAGVYVKIAPLRTAVALTLVVVALTLVVAAGYGLWQVLSTSPLGNPLPVPGGG